MKSIAMNLLGNASDAEDAVQETFLKIHRASSAFQGSARLSTWTYRILLNSCYDLMRRRKRRAEDALEAVPAAAMPESGAGSQALRLALEQCLARLPERPRAVFVLFAIEGFSHREIGETLGLPEATSRTLLFEAKRRLQSLLGQTRGAVGASA